MSSFNAPNPKAPAIYGSIWSLWGIAAFTVILRFKARKIRRLSWEIDDYAVLVALFFTFATCISSSLVARVEIGARFGIGKHIQYVSEEDQANWNKTLFYGNLVYVATGPSIKIAALLMYQRVFAVPKFRLVVRVLCGICFAWYVGETIGCIWNCIPISGFWNKSIPAKCISTRDFDLQYAIINISLDAIILALPVKMVLGLQLSKPQKMAFVLLFLMGGFATVAAIVRLIVFIRNLKSPDSTYVWFEGDIWSCFEPSIGVISVCLPMLRPIVLAVLPHRFRSSAPRESNHFLFNGSKQFGRSDRATALSSSRLRKMQMDARLPYQPFVRLENDEIPLQLIEGTDSSKVHSEATAVGSEVAEKQSDEELGGADTIVRRTDVDLQFDHINR